MTLLRYNAKITLPYVQIQIRGDKTNPIRRMIFVTVANIRSEFEENNPLLALFNCLYDRIIPNEKLVTADFLFGAESKLDGVKYTLTLEFMNKLNREVCILLFGEESDRVVKYLLYRKGGTPSLYTTKVE